MRARDGGSTDLGILVTAFAMLAGFVACGTFLLGAQAFGLALAAAATVIVVGVIVVTSAGDRTRNRFSAAAWDRSVSAPPPVEKPESEPEIIAVSSSGEAERLTDAGSAAMGLTIAAGVLFVAAYYVPGVVA